jgi:hypothetical protein
MIGASILVLITAGCPNPSVNIGPPRDPSVPPDWYVPGDFGTIQAAINNAAAGESILVASGTYYEHITLKDGVTLLGEDRDTTIIDANRSGGMVVSSANCGADTVIDGFTITKGGGPIGGGMYNENSSVTVRTCSFTANQAHSGGGMYNSGGSPTIENCVFSGNAGFGENSGAGMYNVGASPTISGCFFENNVAERDSGSSDNNGRGGGMYNENCSNVTIDDCVFEGNQTKREGGGMYNDNSTVTLTDCFFWHNRYANVEIPQYPGGAMYNNSGSVCTLVNCVFAGNSSAGGVFHTFGTSTLYNCTFCNNEGSGGILYCGAGTMSVYNSIIWDNNFGNDKFISEMGGTISVEYSNVEGVVHSGEGNISSEPGFIENPSYSGGTDGYWYDATTTDFGDLRLSSGSPCIDAGNNSDVPSGTATDIAGRTRILDGPDPGSTATVDMGAYEY